MSKNKYSKNKNIALVNQVVELSDVLKSGEKNYVVKNYELTKEVDATFHELEGYKEHNKQLLEEVERLKELCKKAFIEMMKDGSNANFNIVLEIKKGFE